MTTVALLAEDFEGAKRWYAELLGIAPYFEQPWYAEFRVGDHQQELGILNARYAGQLGGVPATDPPGGVVLYWHVDDLDAALARVQEMGATLFQPPRQFGEGFTGACVVDPFGNLLGLMRNAHYLEVLAAGRGRTGS
ncbi:VOC family protein [Kineococcus sp. SYSU DK002]|uniref:VOC family protein n=1 Tax=Kineococcus sp. SYSU DK002 TaxID=3383123 RepID=UPI003D7CA9AE